MKKIINYIKLMLQDRGGTPNTKLHFGSLFAIVMIVGLFVDVDNALYQTFTFATLCLFGISAVDNLTSPKITIDKTETTKKDTKTEIDVAEIVGKVNKKK
ncbi:MAG: hypothetical protein II417_02915 [Elusimicrobia bacterium]|nr:hypothetical protein [Elusimicrobiota bacterium]